MEVCRFQIRNHKKLLEETGHGLKDVKKRESGITYNKGGEEVPRVIWLMKGKRLARNKCVKTAGEEEGKKKKE